MIWQRLALLGLPLIALPAVLCGAESGNAPTMSMAMPGVDGPYPMAREASGTSWQPDSTPLGGSQRMDGRWMTMWGGIANLIDDNQGGARGGSSVFSNSVLMVMGRRELEGGACGLHGMLSADPLTAKNGYPELFQTGETADGVHPLIDRQHPHNLLMETAGTCSLNLADDRAIFVYAGIAGEPALGPPAFMHRFSGVDDPEAPLSHHWLDSTHVTYGVVTAGLCLGSGQTRGLDVQRPRTRPVSLRRRAARLGFVFGEAVLQSIAGPRAANQFGTAREPGAARAHGFAAPQHRLGELQLDARAHRIAVDDCHWAQ